MPSLSLAIDARGAKSGANEFNSAAKSAEGSASRLSGSVDKAEHSMGLLGTTAHHVGEAVAGFFAVFAAERAIHKSIEGMIELEESMIRVNLAGKYSAQGVLAIDNALLKMGATTEQSSKVLTDSFVSIDKFVNDASRSMEVNRNVVNLAKVGHIDMAQATDVVTTAMKEFNVATDQSAHVTDIFATLAVRTSKDLGAMSERAKTAGANFSEITPNLEDMAATMEVMDKSFSSGNMAFMKATQVLMTMADPSTEAIKNMTALGISSSSISPKIQGVSGALTNLGKAIRAGLNPNDLFQQGLSGTAAKLIRLAPAFETARQAYVDNEGSAEKYAEILDTTLCDAINKTINSMKALGIALVTPLAPALKNVADFTRDVTLSLLGYDDSLKKAHDGTEVFGNTARATAEAIKTIGTGVGVFTGVATAIGIVRLAMLDLNVAMLANPWTAAILAISALVTALIHYKGTVIEIGDVTVTIGELASAVWDELGARFKTMTEGLGEGWKDFKTTFKQVCEDLKPEWTTFTEWMGRAFDNDLLRIKNAVESLNTMMNDIIKSLPDSGLTPANTAVALTPSQEMPPQGNMFSPEEMDFSETYDLIKKAKNAGGEAGLIFMETLTGQFDNLGMLFGQSMDTADFREQGLSAGEMYGESFIENFTNALADNKVTAALNPLTFREGVLGRLPKSGTSLGPHTPDNAFPMGPTYEPQEPLFHQTPVTPTHEPPATRTALQNALTPTPMEDRIASIIEENKKAQEELPTKLAQTMGSALVDALTGKFDPAAFATALETALASGVVQAVFVAPLETVLTILMQPFTDILTNLATDFITNILGLATIQHTSTAAQILDADKNAFLIITAINANTLNPQILGTKLAAGGIVTSPTIALVGEAGPEAVIPLKKFASGGFLGIGGDSQPSQPNPFVTAFGNYMNSSGNNSIFDLLNPFNAIDNINRLMGQPTRHREQPQYTDTRAFYQAAASGDALYGNQPGSYHASASRPPGTFLDFLFPNNQNILGNVGNSAAGLLLSIASVGVNSIPAGPGHSFLQYVLSTLSGTPFPSTFNPNTVQGFALGGVVGGPTLFRDGGSIGLMGEAGPEAVMPLSRGSDGKLGVKSGGGRGVTIHMNISTPDADSFRRSQRQLIKDARRYAGGR
jgi:TP901 family phage tail tape measure protein